MSSWKARQQLLGGRKPLTGARMRESGAHTAESCDVNKLKNHLCSEAGGGKNCAQCALCAYGRRYTEIKKTEAAESRE